MSEAISLGIAVRDLRPTQMTVGFREVERKRREWRDADDATKIKLLRRHVVPAVLGPKERTYIVDHHHFAKALLDEKAETVGIYILADLSNLAKGEFWTFLDNNNWCHAYDASGERCGLTDVPKSLPGLVDDPYRSLVSELIRAGGCAKSTAPFYEFLWADFLRRRIKKRMLEENPEAALTKALDLSKSIDAKSLPGWSGAAHAFPAQVNPPSD